MCPSIQIHWEDFPSPPKSHRCGAGGSAAAEEEGQDGGARLRSTLANRHAGHRRGFICRERRQRCCNQKSTKFVRPIAGKYQFKNKEKYVNTDREKKKPAWMNGAKKTPVRRTK